MDGYTVAVIADIHGNAAALEAVLAELGRERYDELVVAGDLVLFGPRPAEALAAVRRLAAPTISGNTDRLFLPDVPLNHPLLAAAGATVEWVRERIGGDRVAFLVGLPFDRRVTPPGGSSPGEDLLVVHATPTDVDAILILERNPVAGTEVTAEAEARRLVGETEANLILYGHIHYASAGTVAGRRLASVGAVGMPLDGDPRAAYALVRWGGGEWRVEHRRVAYDHRAVAEELLAAGMPKAEAIARRLTEARPVPLG